MFNVETKTKQLVPMGGVGRGLWYGEGYMEDVMHWMSRCSAYVSKVKGVPEKGNYISKLYWQWKKKLVCQG